MSLTIATIVEGQSEVESVPILIRRMLLQLGVHDAQPTRPFRVKRNRIVKEEELERAIRQLISDRDSVGCILVLLDAEDDCPGQLGPDLLKRCINSTQLPVAVILANREFEAWFLGAKESLRGLRGIRHDAGAPASPEQIRGAKEQLTRNIYNHRYLEVDDQPALAAEMDLGMARRRCPSFDRLWRELERIVKEATAAR